MRQLRLQHAVLFAQVQNDLVLFMLEPAEEGRDEELHRNHGAESTQLPGTIFGHYGVSTRETRIPSVLRHNSRMTA